MSELSPCKRCGYLLEPFDDHCRRCGLPRNADAPAGETMIVMRECKRCGRIFDGSRGLECPHCGYPRNITSHTTAFGDETPANLNVRCSKCGRLNVDYVLRCVQCGQPLKDAPPSPTSSDHDYLASHPVTAVSSSGNTVWILLAVIVIICLLFWGAGGSDKLLSAKPSLALILFGWLAISALVIWPIFALLLCAAAWWVEKEDVEFSEAFVTVLVSVGWQNVLGLLIILFLKPSHSVLIGLPVLFLVTASIISKRLLVPFFSACLMLLIAVSIFAGIFGLLAAIWSIFLR